MAMVFLNATNHVALRGPITDATASAAIHAALTMSAPPALLFLDTPGGSVFAGQRIIELVMQLGMACVAARAHSMGFAILQHCATRWLTPGATLMQHGVSVRRMDGDVRDVGAYLRMVETVEHDLNAAQAKRLGVDVAWFRNQTSREWWLTSREALEVGAADRIADVRCARALARQNTTSTDGKVWSACPLVTEPLLYPDPPGTVIHIHHGS